MLDWQKYNINLKEYLKFQKGVHVWLVQKLYWTVVLIKVYNTPPQEKVRPIMTNSCLRLYLLYYRVSQIGLRKNSNLFHI